MEFKAGFFVDKKTRKPIFGFRPENVDVDSIEDLISDHGNLQDKKIELIPEEKLDKPMLEIEGYHRIKSDGTIEDKREIIGYRVKLEKKVKVKDKHFSEKGKVFKVDDREQAEELAKKSNTEITNFEEIKRLKEGKN